MIIDEAVKVLSGNLALNIDLIKIITKMPGSLPPDLIDKTTINIINNGLVISYKMYSSKGIKSCINYYKCAESYINYHIKNSLSGSLIQIRYDSSDCDCNDSNGLKHLNNNVIFHRTIDKRIYNISHKQNMLDESCDDLVTNFISKQNDEYANNLLLEWESNKSNRDDYIFVGIKTNYLIGMCSIKNERIEILNKNIACLNNIYISPQYRRLGYGKKLLNIALNSYNGEWIYISNIDNTSSVHTALSCGFQKCGFIKSYEII